jgi:transcription antitermination factor NusG
MKHALPCRKRYQLIKSHMTDDAKRVISSLPYLALLVSTLATVPRPHPLHSTAQEKLAPKQTKRHTVGNNRKLYCYVKREREIEGGRRETESDEVALVLQRTTTTLERQREMQASPVF